MSASFLNVILIDGDGHIIPGQRQPLGTIEDFKEGVKVLRIEAWVFQGDGACVASVLNPVGETWEFNPKLTDYFGPGLRPGGKPSGMGLSVSEKDGRQFVQQWTKPITLVEG
jgi:hypothetical protein